MNRVIKYDEEAKQSIINGIDTVANIVKTTVGPKGRNVLIRNNLDTPIITNDGVTIAKSVQLKDNAEDAGASLIRSAANKTNEIAGDGTTTTTILAQEMIHKYYELASDDVNSVQVQKEMIAAGNEISEYLKTIATPANDTDSIKRVASISSGSEQTGELIAQAFEMAGKYGSVIVEDSKTGADNLVNINGMKLSIGSVTPYLMTDKTEMKSEVMDASILITRDKISDVSEFIPILDMCNKEGRKLLIICDDIEYEPLQMLLINKARGAALNINIIRLPGFGDLRDSLLEDIALATGATILGRDIGLSLRDFNSTHLGEADQIIVTLDDTIIKFKDTSSTGVDLATIREERVNEIRGMIDRLPVNESDEQYKRRISNLTSGISIIQIGGNSEVEIKDKKLRIEDAINSVSAAKEEGIVPGGGYSFLMAIQNKPEGDTLGSIIVYESLKAVTRQIAENAGANGNNVVEYCLSDKLGFNALTGNYENLIETGVINSAKVDRYSVINSVSVASTVITMGGLIVDENEKDSNILQLQGPALGTMM